MQISNNTILITGGATGIGFALAEYFIREGNDVIICGRRSDKLEEAKYKLPGLHARVADVSSHSDRIELISWVIDNHPSFNILVNNAGIQQMISLRKEYSAGSIENEISTNLTAPIQLTNLVVPYFLTKKEAAIINITSGLGFVPLVMTPVYCATKAALHSFSISSRYQLKETPIKIFEIIPPIVETELGKDGSRKGRDVRGIPPSEIAVETLKAMKSDNYENPIGSAVNLYRAAHSDKVNFVVDRMNE